MSDSLLFIVSRSLLFILLLSLALLVFIVAHRLISERRGAAFQARYLRIELELLQTISTGEIGPAIEAAAKFRSQSKVLTQVLIDFPEIISGRGPCHGPIPGPGVAGPGFPGLRAGILSPRPHLHEYHLRSRGKGRTADQRIPEDTSPR